MKKIVFILIFVVGSFFVSGVSHAATITWIASGPGSWTTASNWSTDTVPTSTDNVIFSASSTGNCTINGGYPNYNNAGGITITSGYTGTITQNSGAEITVGNSGWNQSGGSFVGSSGTSGTDAVNVNGPFSLASGTFTSTAGVLTILGVSSTFTGTFNNNSGMVTFGSTSTSATITGSATFYGLNLGAYSLGSPNVEYNFTVPTGTVLTAISTTTFNGYYSNDIYLWGGGTIDAQGSILLSNPESAATPTSTFNLVLDGTGTQTVSDQGYHGGDTGYNIFFFLPSVTINKPSGVVNLFGDIAITGNFTNDDGSAVLNAGTSTVIFDGATTTSTPVTTTIQGSSTFNNLWFGLDIQYAATSTFVIATGTTLNAQNQLYLRDNGGTLQLQGGGAINVQGNIETSQYTVYSASNIPITVNGAGAQTVGDASTCFPDATYGCSTLLLPGLTITKTSGTLTFENAILINGNFTNTNDTTINPTTSTVIFGEGDNENFPIDVFGGSANWPAPTSSFTIAGSSTFYNILFGSIFSGNGLTETLSTGTVLTAEGDLELGGSYESSYQVLGGEIDVSGNIVQPSSASYSESSTVAVFLKGTGTQLIGALYSNDCSCGGNEVLPSLTIAKPSGVAYVTGNGTSNPNTALTVQGTTTISQGELDLATGTTPISTTFDGPITVNSGARLSDYAQATSTVTLGSSMTNNGTIFFAGDGNGCALPLPTYISIKSTHSGTQRSWSGSGNFVMRYVAVKDQNNTGSSISVWDGTNNGDNTNWTFYTGFPRPQLVQGTSGTGSGASLTLPAFGFQPRATDLILVAVSAKNESIAAPTDNASDTYVLVASSTVGLLPTYSVGLYYAKNINTTSSLVVTANGSSGGLLSASAFEYTGMAPSTTFDNDSSNALSPPSTSTAISSLSATGLSANELYFGAMTINASTTAAAESGWTPELGVTNNTTNQALYVEDMATTTSEVTAAATWTAVTGTSYVAVMGIFHSPYAQGYSASGTLDSATFDTGIASGTQLNSVSWQGMPSAGSWANWDGQAPVGFQFAVSSSSAGPWTFEGPSGDATTYFEGSPATSISLRSLSGAYNLFTGYRYFRYRITLFSDPTYTYSPIVNQVIVNWSP